MRKNVPGRLWCFQSTPPRRRRRIKCTGQSRYIFFNPRLREGGDLRAVVQFHLYLMLFNPRLREGGDFIILFVVYNNRFQSTPPRRRRRCVTRCCNPHIIFQSTPPRRRRPIAIFDVRDSRFFFNPRLREGGDDTI